jgi:MFS family permease
MDEEVDEFLGVYAHTEIVGRLNSMVNTGNLPVLPVQSPSDFRLFWAGQVVSSLGSSFTSFAVPLLVFTSTGSAVDLGLATAATFLAYPLLGLPIGALVDRFDRKRLMIVADLIRASTILSIALLAFVGEVSIWWIAGCGFVASTCSIAFDAGATAAVVSVVGREELVRANGRLQAGDAGAQVVGPLLAGAIVSVAPLELVLSADAASFVVSAISLAVVKASFGGGATEEARPSMVQAIGEGLRFTLSRPVLRELALLAALFNFVGRTVVAQLVLFATVQLAASDAQIAVLFAAASAGTVVFALAAARVRRRVAFSTAVLGAVIAIGLQIVALSQTASYPVALLLVGGSAGLIAFFNVNTTTLRQLIAPPELLGRVTSVARVLSWSAIPLGALLGGWAIEETGDVALVYAVIGVLIAILGAAFHFTALGRAEQYLPAPAPGSG